MQPLYPFERLWAETQLRFETKETRKTAGVDVSYSGNRHVSALVLFEGHEISDIKVKTGTSREEYRPSLFFLKEGSILSELIYGVPIDLLFVNGHGICHPYSYGLATVIGLSHGIPTIGFARSLIKGKYDRAPSATPNHTYIAQDGVIRAIAITTPKGKNPVYISQGFGISLKRMVEEYERWALRSKVPEPLRLAHLHARRQLDHETVPGHTAT